MSNIQETLFRAIETITDSKINQIKFDKTIEAIIIADDKSDVGEYELKYQDLIFTAYSSNNTAKYSKEENVLVLVPDGDMSKKKTIISSNKREGDVYIDVDKVIDKLGINFVDEAPDYQVGLSTTSDEVISFKLKKELMINQYPGQKYLSIGAEIYSNINTADIDGLYGIAVDCMFLNNEGERIPHTFEFNTLNVTGNPYQARGYKETQIPLLEERLVEVVGGRVFSKGFTAGNEKIIFSNLNIEYVNIREQDRSEYSGNIIAPRGTHFRSNILYPDEKLELIMEFKQKGQVLETAAIDYKWFVMNGEVNSTEHEDYHPDGGMGWEWIKTNSYDKNLVTGAATSTLLVAADFVPTFSSLKCIATYTDKSVIVSDMVTLVDHTEKVDVEIVSDNGVSFVNGIGATNLTCNITQNGKPLEQELDYEWSQIKADGTVTLVQKGSKNAIRVVANTIGVKSTYTCEVSLAEASRPIATGNLTLVNVIDGSSQGVVVVGGFRTVLYSGGGEAPDNLPKDGFQFDVYDNGEKVTTGIKWKWSIPPVENTLLTLENATVEADGTQSTTNAVLNLGVLNKFDFSKNQNTISLEVEYTKNGLTSILKDFTNIAITKVGQNGADGAAGTIGQDGKTYVYELQGGSKTIIYDKNGQNPKPKKLPPIELMFSIDGDTEIANEVDRVEWDIQGANESVLGFADKEKSVRRITTSTDLNGQSDNPHIISLVADDEWRDDKFNNIVSAKITYKGKVFRETFPISVVKNGTDGEMGLSVSTSPAAYSVDAESDGNIIKNVSVLINFDIYRSNNKIEDFRVVSIGGTPRGASTSIEGSSVKVEFLKGRDLPDNGIIEIELDIQGNPYRQTFSYSKVRGGESPYLMVLQSTNGLVFKRGDISTVIYAIVMKGSSIVTDEIAEEAFEWEKIDKDGQVIANWEPTYVDNQRDKIVITPEDIMERATFNCSLNL